MDTVMKVTAMKVTVAAKVRKPTPVNRQLPAHSEVRIKFLRAFTDGSILRDKRHKHSSQPLPVFIMSLAIPNGLDNTVERPGERAPLVLGETTYHDITEAVCKVAERPPSAGWVAGFLFSFALLHVLGLLHPVFVLHRCRCLGKPFADLLGLADCQLRFLGRYRTRGNVD